MSDLTVAIAAPLLQSAFHAVVDKFKFVHQGDATLGPITLHYDVAFHFRNDTLVQPVLELRDDGTVYLHNLKILWDKLELTIGVDIPEICVGGFCLIPIPFDGCAVEAPKFCLFSDDPDFSFTLAIDQFVTSEVSVEGHFNVVHWNNPNRQPGDSDWDAHRQKRANHWRLSLVPTIVHVDPFHLADIVGDLFKKAIEDNVNNLISGAPDWAKALIDALLGGIETLIRVTLGLGDNLVQWLEEQLNGPVGLLDVIETFVADYFANKTPIPITEDPAPVGEDPTNPNALIPIMLPIVGLAATVNSKELVLQGGIG